MKVNFKIIVFYIVLIAAIIFMLSFMLSRGAMPKLQYSDIVAYFENEQGMSAPLKSDI